MATVDNEYSSSIESGLLSLLQKVQNMLQVSPTLNVSYTMNASIEAPNAGDWAIHLGQTSNLNLQGVQLKTIFSRNLDLHENVHIQLTATSIIGNLDCYVDGFIPQLATQPMDLILNIKSHDSQANLPVEQLLALAGLDLKSLPAEFPIKPGMLLGIPPKSCTMSLQKSTADEYWTTRLLTFQMTLSSDWIVIPNKIVWLAENIELHIKQNHQIIASGTAVIGSSPPQRGTMTVTGDDKDGNRTIVLSLVQGSTHDIWSALTNPGLDSNTPVESQFPSASSGTLVIRCRASTDDQYYEIAEVEFKVPFAQNPASSPPLPAIPPQSSPSNNTPGSTQPLQVAEASSSSNPKGHTAHADADRPMTEIKSGSTMPLNPASSPTGAAATAPSLQGAPNQPLSPPAVFTPNNPLEIGEADSCWNIANAGTWTVTSLNPHSVMLTAGPEDFDPTQPPLQLRPSEIGALVASRINFTFSFGISVNSATSLSLPMIDTGLTNSLKAVWEPEEQSTSFGSLRWFQRDAELNVAKVVISQAQPATLRFFYAYNTRKQWTLVVFQDEAYITNVDSRFKDLGVNWSPDPGIAIGLTQNASVEVTARDVTIETSDISGPIS